MNVVADLLVEPRGSGLVWITINRPSKHNALALPVLAKLVEAIRSAGDDSATRCILVRGAGDKYFAAGGDVVDLASVRTEAATRAMADDARSALDVVRACPVPVVAYVNGDALGGGAELAVACDFRMLEAHARIGYVHGRMAITSAWGGGPDLCQLVGGARALRMMTRCEMIGAETALAWGLVDVVVTGGAEGADVQAFLGPLLERSRLALCGAKHQARAWREGLGYARKREVERDHLVATWLSDEHWAAVERFLGRDKT